MAICKPMPANHRKLCAGDLIHEVQVLEKSLVPPVAGSVDYKIEFDQDKSPVVFASLSTPRGKVIFDNTGTGRDVTHVFGLYFNPDYTSENVVLFDGRFFDVLDVNDLDERHEWMVLSCAERGDIGNKANR